MELVLDNTVCCIHLFIGLELSVPNKLSLTDIWTELHAAKIVPYLLSRFRKITKDDY